MYSVYGLHVYQYFMYVLQFNPKSGPHLGGTMVTIEGRNLGKDFRQVRDGVRVGGRQCRVLEARYEPSVRLVCETAGGTLQPARDVVKVKVEAGDNGPEAVTTDMFSFKVRL